jgi:ectoine hydroxylase-related dioxygenase (phytanoyl-CoA dioxygenase family)
LYCNTLVAFDLDELDGFYNMTGVDVSDNKQLQKQLSDEGFCILPNLLSDGRLEDARAALQRAIEAGRRAGVDSHTKGLDPNSANVRVYNLPEHDPLFVELLQHPTALEMVTFLLGQHFIVSNFSANVAMPGSGSMRLHSDQALVIPPPWSTPWAINVIWCLTDVHESNGATRFLPGSQQYQRFEDVPGDAADRTKAFEAPAGSAIIMDGRVWHTSGANVTRDEQRAMLFAYYTTDFIRQQMNWEAVLSPATKDRLDDSARRLLGLGPAANTRIGGQHTRLL